MEVSAKKSFKAELTIKFESLEDVEVLKAWLSASSRILEKSVLLKNRPELKDYINQGLEECVIEPIWNELDKLTRGN